ncbi:hypothetical protein BH11CYA1_BH11CYA1_45770 [soil metagenome]
MVSRKTKLTEKDLKEQARLKGHIEENTMSPQAVLETIAALPIDKQAQTIGAGVATFQNELEHQKFRIFVGAVAGIGDGTVSLAKGVEDTGRVICEVAQFSREIMANDPAAVDKAGKVGDAIGKTLVGGVHLFQVADASQLGGAAREKANKFISRMTEELAPQEVGLTADGQIVAIPKHPQITPDAVLNQAKRENIMLSKADDLGEAGAPRLRDADAEIKAAIEKFPPSDKFVTHRKRAIDSLDPDELQYLDEQNIRIQAVRRITDIKTARSPKTLGIYDPESKSIYIAEEVFSLNSWKANTDIMFELRHEFGHALNATAHKFGDWMSNEPGFKAAFKQDFAALSTEQLEHIQFKASFQSNLELIRDEVFADVYAHSSGLDSNNPYSKMLKAAFPNCLKYMREDFMK